MPTSRRSFSAVDLNRALRELNPRVKQAFELSHEALLALGIPHVVVGGLAVNAHGHQYATKDVDYLVTEADAFEGSVVVTHRPGVPFRVAEVPIDFVVEVPSYPEKVKQAMRENIAAARSRADKVVVVQDWLLVWMKLNAGRNKDRAAVEGLVKAGLDVPSVREHLVEAGPQRIVEMFDDAVATAEGE